MVWIFLSLVGVCSTAIAISAVLRSRAGFDTPRAHVARMLSRIAKTVMVVLLIAWSAWALIPPANRCRIAFRYFNIPLGIPEDMYAGPLGSVVGLHHLDCEAILDLYADLLTDSDANVRIGCARVVGNWPYWPDYEGLEPIDNPATLAKLRVAADDPSPEVSMTAITLIGYSRNCTQFDFLLEKLRSVSLPEMVRLSLVYSLFGVRDQRTPDALIALSSDPMARVRRTAVRLLGNYETPRVLEALSVFAAGSDQVLAEDACSAAVMILRDYTFSEPRKRPLPAAMQALTTILMAFASNTNVSIRDRYMSLIADWSDDEDTLPLKKQLLLAILREALSSSKSPGNTIPEVIDDLESVERSTGARIDDPDYIAAKAKRDAERSREDPKMAGKAKKAPSRKAASAK